MYYLPLDAVSIDEVLGIYFDQLSGENINMVIVGANNGDLKDFLTGYLEKENVTAVLVEPIAHLFSELKNKFAGAKNLIFENVAIDSRTRKKKIYRVEKSTDFPDWCMGLGSFSKKVILGHENQVKDLRRHVVTETVNCTTFRKLVRKHKFSEVHLLQIDTEGYDYEIIKSIDFTKTRPDVIIVEYLHITFYQYFAMINILMDNNYRVNKSNSSFDIIAVDAEILS